MGDFHSLGKSAMRITNYTSCSISDRFREMGPNIYILKFPIRNTNVTIALECMAN